MFCNRFSVPPDHHLAIAFAGAPSSGKDTVADMVQMALNNSTHKVYEVAREYITELGVPYNIMEQHIIYEKQTNLEELASKTYQVVLTPCPPFLCLVYGTLLLKSDSTKAEKACAVDLFGKAISSIQKYDHIFLCDQLSSYDEDGPRYQNSNEATEVHNMIVSMFSLLRVNHTVLPNHSNLSAEENIENRVKIVMETIGASADGLGE